MKTTKTSAVYLRERPRSSFSALYQIICKHTGKENYEKYKLKDIVKYQLHHEKNYMEGGTAMRVINSVIAGRKDLTL